MIYEITGQPGHGKTLYALHFAREFKKQGREVYAHGVTELDHAKLGFLELQDPREWQSVPDNSVILIDECYSAFPNRNAASAVPPHVEPLARHRHRGLDIILVHQQPDQVDPFVRGLVDQHVHVRRKWGFGGAVLKTWDYSEPKPIKAKALRAPVWRYDKSLYDVYRSATMHTVKKKLPWQLFIVLPVLAFVCWVFWRFTSGRAFADEVAPATASAPASAGAFAGVGGARERPDYATWITPRIPGLPWTAPAYDDQQPTQVADLYCMAGGPGEDASGAHVGETCTCLTEQGTRYLVNLAVCRSASRYGIYNPFRKVPAESHAARSEAGEAQPSAVGVVGTSSVLVQPQGAFGRVAPVMPAEDPHF